MANEYLKYFIEAIWKGKGATAEAKKDIKGVGDSSSKSAKGVNLFKNAVGVLAASAVLSVVAKQAYDFGKASVDAFSDSKEAYGKFSIVFGDFADKTEGNLEAIADATGRSKYELIDFASTIQDTFVPLGFARGEAAKMATEVTELAVDLASFNNLRTEDVIRDLQSALVGNTETLRKYGVVAQETQIKQEALSLGLWDGTGAIDAQAKANAILSLTYKGTTDAQGDAIRTADSLANKQRALTAATLDLKVAFGEGLAPSLAEATGEATETVKWLADGINQSKLLEDALATGLVTNSEYAAGMLKLGVGIKLSDEFITELTKRVRENESEMTDAEATVINYYKGMGQLAEATEGVEVESGALTPALMRLREEYQRTAEGSQEFAEKTGMSAAALREEEEAALATAAAFQSSFVSALGNTSDAYYTNAVNGSMLNEQLFSQITAMSDNTLATTTAAIALGVYDEAQVATALNAAIIEEKINQLAEAFVNGEINAGQMKSEMDNIVANSPYTSEIEVLTDQAISNIDKVKSKLDAIDGLVAKARIEVSGGGSIPSGSASSGGGSGGRGDIPEFAGGGMVPGPVGSPQLILAHGGEQVLTRGQQGGGGGDTINIYNQTREAAALALAQVYQTKRSRLDAYMGVA